MMIMYLLKAMVLFVGHDSLHIKSVTLNIKPSHFNVSAAVDLFHHSNACNH